MIKHKAASLNNFFFRRFNWSKNDFKSRRGNFLKDFFLFSSFVVFKSWRARKFSSRFYFRLTTSFTSIIPKRQIKPWLIANLCYQSNTQLRNSKLFFLFLLSLSFILLLRVRLYMRNFSRHLYIGKRAVSKHTKIHPVVWFGKSRNESMERGTTVTMARTKNKWNTCEERRRKSTDVENGRVLLFRFRL